MQNIELGPEIYDNDSDGTKWRVLRQLGEVFRVTLHTKQPHRWHFFELVTTEANNSVAPFL